MENSPCACRRVGWQIFDNINVTRPASLRLQLQPLTCLFSVRYGVDRVRSRGVVIRGMGTPENMTTKERRDHLLAMRLRWTPQFRELIHRLDSGKTVWSVTDWFMQQKNLGDLSGCTFSTAYQYIGWRRGFTTSRSDTVATCLLPKSTINFRPTVFSTNSLDDGFRGHTRDLHDDGLTRPIFHVSPLSICSRRICSWDGYTHCGPRRCF